MRLGTILAVGALATFSAAALSQVAVQQMDFVRAQELLARRWVPQPQPQPQPPQAPPINFRGCAYFEHDNWQGKWRSITGGTRRLAVGSSWDHTISSFSCNPACRVVAFKDSFKGERGEFPTIASVGPAWNDQIKSMIAVCQHPF